MKLTSSGSRLYNFWKSAQALITKQLSHNALSYANSVLHEFYTLFVTNFAPFGSGVARATPEPNGAKFGTQWCKIRVNGFMEFSAHVTSETDDKGERVVRFLKT